MESTSYNWFNLLLGTLNTWATILFNVIKAIVETINKKITVLSVKLTFSVSIQPGKNKKGTVT